MLCTWEDMHVHGMCKRLGLIGTSHCRHSSFLQVIYHQPSCHFLSLRDHPKPSLYWPLSELAIQASVRVEVL
jgi:hypothetical protein